MPVVCPRGSITDTAPKVRSGSTSQVDENRGKGVPGRGNSRYKAPEHEGVHSALRLLGLRVSVPSRVLNDRMENPWEAVGSAEACG